MRLVSKNKPGHSPIIIRLVCFLLGSTLSLPAVTAEGYSGGSGDPCDPYQIHSAADLLALGNNPADWQKHFILTADIYLNPSDEEGQNSNFPVIGNSEEQPFKGVFDGNNRIIFGAAFYADIDTENGAAGLFGVIDSPEARITNLKLHNVHIEGGNLIYSGGLTGYLKNGLISNCSVSGIVCGNGDVGGLTGWNDGSINQSVMSGFIRGNRYSGGLAGYNRDKGSITASYGICNIRSMGDAGGLCGRNDGRINNCYAAGQVNGARYSGGLAGWVETGAFIGNSYAAVKIQGQDYFTSGGLAGVNFGGSIYVAFWDIDVAGIAYSAGGIGKNTPEMMQLKTFLGWGCENMWTINQGRDYPRLAWQGKDGEKLDNPGFPEYFPGLGTAQSPYEIYTAQQLNLIGQFPCQWDKHYKLMNDIDLTGFSAKGFNIIGYPFRGVFDGNGKAIIGLSYYSPGESNVGLFGIIDDPNAIIRNLIVYDPNITGRYNVGSIAGNLQNGNISNCRVIGAVIKGDQCVGGLAGISSGNIQTCRVDGDIRGAFDNTGGLVGLQENGTITHCHTSGHIEGNFNYVGGLAGHMNGGTISESYSGATVGGQDDIAGIVGYLREGIIDNCYANGAITGQSYTGGLIGRNDYGQVSKCYSTAAVSGGKFTGGLIGYTYHNTIADSFWDVQSSGQDRSDGGSGLNTDDMRALPTYLQAGWDFTNENTNGSDDIWTICDGTNYPRFSWQPNLVGDMACPEGVGLEDMQFMLQYWLESGGPDNTADLNQDGIVNLADFAILAGNWLTEPE